MVDRYGRKIDYLRVSITDRCNLRCIYCMPAEGVELKPREEILSFEELLRLVRVATDVGFRKFRLTGGEPLVRKGLIEFIRSLVQLPGVEDLSLTTNGILLPQMAAQLKEAGVRRLNISLDTLEPEKYREMTRGGDFSKVWEGIQKSLDLGFDPVKVNVVILKGFNDQDWVDFAELTCRYPVHVRFIEVMSIGTSREFAEKHFAPASQVRERIEAVLGRLVPVEVVTGNGPACYFQVPGAPGKLGFISAVSNHFCSRCNRIRLTADGQLRPCLFDQRELDLRRPLRAGASDQDLAEIFRKAISLKPSSYHEAVGLISGGRDMCQIGG